MHCLESSRPFILVGGINEYCSIGYVCVCVLGRVVGMEALAELCILGGVLMCACVSVRVRGPWLGRHLGHLGSLV